MKNKRDPLFLPLLLTAIANTALLILKIINW